MWNSSEHTQQECTVNVVIFFLVGLKLMPSEKMQETRVLSDRSQSNSGLPSEIQVLINSESKQNFLYLLINASEEIF